MTPSLTAFAHTLVAASVCQGWRTGDTARELRGGSRHRCDVPSEHSCSFSPEGPCRGWSGRSARRSEDTSLTSGALACEGEGPAPPPSTGAQQLSDPGPPASPSTPPRAPPLAHCTPLSRGSPRQPPICLRGVHQVLGPGLAAGASTVSRTVHVLTGFGVSRGTEMQQIST